MENIATDTKNWSDLEKIDDIYNECLENIRNVEIFAQKQLFPTDIENVNSNYKNDSNVKLHHDKNDLHLTQKLETYISDMNGGHKRNMPIIYTKQRTKPKSSTPGSSGNRKIRARRVITKTGLRNIALIMNIPQQSKRFLNDAFTTLIECRWRWIFFWTIAGHFICWLFFAVLWYLTGLAHYDFEDDPPKKLCVTGGHSFLAIFMASMEAQTTLAYGDRSIDETCPETIFILIMNLIIGTALTGVLTSVLFSKLTRPEKMAKEGVGFSKKAVISLRDGQLCLMFRIWDTNQTHIVGTDVSAHIVTSRRTREGEILKCHSQELNLKDCKAFMMWPTVVIHVINENSPFYEMSAKDVLESRFEIAVSLKGAAYSTGIYGQSLASYLPKEVMWGYRFRNVIRYSENINKYIIDHEHLDSLDQIDTPLCSAKTLHQVCRELGVK